MNDTVKPKIITNESGKKLLVEFVEATSTADGTYTIYCDLGQWHAVLQRIRVAFSRARKAINKINPKRRALGKKPYNVPNYKIINQERVEVKIGDTYYDKLVLTRKISRQYISPEAQQFLDTIEKGNI